MKTSAVWPLSLDFPVPSTLTVRFALGLGLPSLLPHRAEPVPQIPTCPLRAPQHASSPPPPPNSLSPYHLHPASLHPVSKLRSSFQEPGLATQASCLTCLHLWKASHMSPVCPPAPLEARQSHLSSWTAESLRRGILLCVPIYPHSTEPHSNGHAKFPVKRNTLFWPKKYCM